MSELELFPYQQRLVDEARAALMSGKRRVLVQLPTGGGKTVIFVSIALRVVERGGRVLILVHGRELVQQAWEEVEKWAPGLAGKVMAGNTLEPELPIQVASIDTIRARKVEVKADLCIFDEAHRSLASTYMEVLGGIDGLRLLGFTATPVRSDGQALSNLYEAIVCGPQVRELIEANRLVDCEVISAESYEKGKLSADPVEAWDKYARREDGSSRPGFAFFSTKALAKEAVDGFRAIGIRAVYLGDDTKKRERETIKRDFVLGEVQVICNVNVATEGYNLPSAEVCLLASNCDSVGPYIQRVGRVLRYLPGKGPALLIDLVGVSWLYGLPTEDRDYEVDGIKAKTKDVGMALRHCHQCFATFKVGPKACPRCGEEITLTERQQEILEREMVRRNRPKPIVENASLEDMKKNFRWMMREARARGHKKTAPYAKFHRYYGMSPKQAGVIK